MRQFYPPEPETGLGDDDPSKWSIVAVFILSCPGEDNGKNIELGRRVVLTD